jgi:hypothetical protein
MVKKGAKESWVSENKRFLYSLGVFALILLGITWYGWLEAGYEASRIIAKPNVEMIIEICTLACEELDVHSYCEKVRTIRYAEPMGATFLREYEDTGGVEPLTQETTKLRGTCKDIGFGIIEAMSWNGVLTNYSVSFPTVNVPKCENLCS